MFGKIVKGAALFGLGYIIYKLGYGNGMKTADPTLKQLEADLLNGKLTMQEYSTKVNNRINELEGRC
jgi:hypothetical protein